MEYETRVLTRHDLLLENADTSQVLPPFLTKLSMYQSSILDVHTCISLALPLAIS